MKKYLTAIFDYSDASNRVFLLDAENDVDAAKKSLIQHCPEKYRDEKYLDWVEGLGNTLEEIMNGAVQSDLILTTPFSITSINKLALLNQTKNETT